MGIDLTMVGILASLAPLAAFSLRREMRRQKAARAALDRAQALGLDEPVSLHPDIDPNRCVGCAGCIQACPEGDVLLLIDGRARLVNAAHCAGHGACKTACPQDAIELVFGTAKRGIQIPEVDCDYQSNVPGLYIVGELGGMGLIRNAIAQGVAAVRHLAKTAGNASPSGGIDVAIVGAGPAGIAAALACREQGLRAVLVDQDGLGGSVNHYPRRKLVMTTPAQLPIVGRMHFREVGKETLLEFWTDVVRSARLEMRAPERVLGVSHLEDGFRLATDRGEIAARHVVLAIGRRGTPRRLGVPGESTAKVAYRLIEPERWHGQRVLVVGGGNSAVEAAVSLAEAGARATLSYRGSRLTRVAPENQARLDAARDRGLEVRLESHVERIEPERVWLQTANGPHALENDQVFVLIGGELPDEFLAKAGVLMRWHHGKRAPKPDRTGGVA